MNKLKQICIDLKAFINCRTLYSHQSHRGSKLQFLCCETWFCLCTVLLGLYLNNNTSFVAHVAFFIERQNKELRTKIITSLAIFHKMLFFCTWHTDGTLYCEGNDVWQRDKFHFLSKTRIRRMHKFWKVMFPKKIKIKEALKKELGWGGGLVVLPEQAFMCFNWLVRYWSKCLNENIGNDKLAHIWVFVSSWRLRLELTINRVWCSPVGTGQVMARGADQLLCSGPRKSFRCELSEL